MQLGKEMLSGLKIRKSPGDKIALWITDTFGSMLFLFLCMIFFMLWILWNLRFFHSVKPFDPYPFTMLTMIVSIFAIVLSVAVLISQNRSGKLESKRQQIEFEVSLVAEKEITKMLGMLHDIQVKLGIDDHLDTELSQMKEDIDVQDIHDRISESSET